MNAQHVIEELHPTTPGFSLGFQQFVFLVRIYVRRSRLHHSTHKRIEVVIFYGK